MPAATYLSATDGGYGTASAQATVRPAVTSAVAANGSFPR